MFTLHSIGGVWVGCPSSPGDCISEGCATFNIIQGKAPSYLLELFDRHVPAQCPSRQCVPNTFTVPSCRTSAYRNSFHLSEICFWHSLPAPVISAPTIGVLKSRLYDHLFAFEAIDA